MRSRDRRRCSGYSLAELVFSLLLLSIVSITLVGVVPATMSGTRMAADRVQASIIAQQTLETLGAGNLTDIRDGPLPDVETTRGAFGRGVSTFAITTAQGTAIDRADALGVQVTVSWRDRANTASSLASTRVLFVRN